ncbi:MAG: Co2+/Mg2+ efflux protein ApaG [Pseudomonadales bacterium]
MANNRVADIPISIHVDKQFLDKQSSPENNRYVFAYTVTISNHGVEAVKLISRHWLITDGNNTIQEVKGDGVVGEQPLIAPGAYYRYSSGALLKTAVGTMEGSYQMRSHSGLEFNALIPLFSLIHPDSLH